MCNKNSSAPLGASLCAHEVAQFRYAACATAASVAGRGFVLTSVAEFHAPIGVYNNKKAGS